MRKVTKRSVQRMKYVNGLAAIEVRIYSNKTETRMPFSGRPTSHLPIESQTLII